MPVAAAYGSARVAQRAQLRISQKLWDSLRLRNYTFRIRYLAFPVPGGNAPVTITVRNGRPSDTSARLKHAYDGLPLDTIPNLFRQLRHTLADPKAGKVVVRYDKHRGFPISASLDPSLSIVDDEFGWTIYRFRPL